MTDWGCSSISKINTVELISTLRSLGKIMASDKNYSEKEIVLAKNLATKLYILHSERKINLKTEEFQMVLDIVEFNPIG